MTPDETTEDAVSPGGLDAWDPGLARDRTDLSWQRSGLAALVAVAVMVRHLWPLTGYKSALVFGVTAVAALVWAAGKHRSQRSRPEATDGSMAVHSRHLRMLTLGTLLLAAAGLLSGIFLPG
jgi:hypothetical protein